MNNEISRDTAGYLLSRVRDTNYCRHGFTLGSSTNYQLTTYLCPPELRTISPNTCSKLFILLGNFSTWRGCWQSLWCWAVWQQRVHQHFRNWKGPRLDCEASSIIQYHGCVNQKIRIRHLVQHDVNCWGAKVIGKKSVKLIFCETLERDCACQAEKLLDKKKSLPTSSTSTPTMKLTPGRHWCWFFGWFRRRRKFWRKKKKKAKECFLFGWFELSPEMIGERAHRKHWTSDKKSPKAGSKQNC